VALVLWARVIPPKRVCEEFSLAYELEGAQKAVDLLAKYYGIKEMRVLVDGRKVGNGNEACYYGYVAYFKKTGLNKRNILHEFYHHLVYVYDWNMKEFEEEKKAHWYSKAITKNMLEKVL